MAEDTEDDKKMHAVRDHVKSMCRQGYVQAGVCIQSIKSKPALSMDQQDNFDLYFLSTKGDKVMHEKGHE